MPTAPKKPCAHPGCAELISSGSRCPAHERTQRRDEDSRRDPAVRALYNSTRWRETSRLYRASNPLCVRCGTLAEVVDHIVPHRGDYQRFWDAGNWQSMCATCHNLKTYHEDGAFGQSRIDNPKCPG